MKPRVLFVDDDAGGRAVAVYNLRRAGYEVDEASGGEEGLEALGRRVYDLLITDVRMPGIGGIELTRRARERMPGMPVLVITAYGEVETAVEAMKAGASDFILKPFSRDQLELAVGRALERLRMQRELERLREQAGRDERPIVSRSIAMRKVLEVVDRVAASEASVLVTGESGTGKELVARRLHARSARSEGPFVAVNCAAISRELVEAELFGHEKGAFTGAHRARPGRFRQAHGGTLFLDEVGELPPEAQAKLLRALQERVVDVVGRDTPVEVDVRVIAATNRDLREAVERGRFREDLFFRLNVVEVHVPPLRERLEDVVPLAEHFVRELSKGAISTLPPAVADALLRRPWRGNVRELRNACERLVILSPPGTVTIDALPPDPGAPIPSASGGAIVRLPQEGASLHAIEAEAIRQALARSGGNISGAARLLRVPRHVLVYRIEKYGLRGGRP